MTHTQSGGCLCGAVRFEADGPFPVVVACHCGQCRRVHGIFGAYVNIPRDRQRLTRDAGLTWYESSPGIRRGFCRGCGSPLFWERVAGLSRSIVAGAFDQPTGFKLGRHIYVADQGDFYRIADGIVCRAQGSDSPEIVPR